MVSMQNINPTSIYMFDEHLYSSIKSCLTRLKSKLNVLSRSGVVYQISCTQCEAFYVGKTKRRLEQRVQEHSQQGYSSLYKHSSDLCHQIDYSNPAVISVDNNDYRLQIKEALKIKDFKGLNFT